MQQTTQTPVDYPRVVIDGRTFTLKMDRLAIFECSQMGLDLTRPLNELIGPDNPQAFANLVKFFAAMTAHNFAAVKRPIRTPEEWIVALPEDIMREIGQKIGEALLKASQAAGTAPAAPGADQQPEPVDGSTPS